MRKNRTPRSSLLSSFTLATASISLLLSVPAFAKEEAKSAPLTVAMKNSAGEDVGTIILTETNKGVKLGLDLHGLTPGEKAIHFHETGDCTGPKFTSAGGHFNPLGKEHGKKSKNGKHAGDLDNIKVSKGGTVKSDLKTDLVTLSPSDHSLLKTGGTAVVIHAKEDDYKSQPAGDAGDRVACGVISAM
ncbi:MAG: superoxide dismutase family protein [Cryobacterium sp.]|nr:superoxide dismutase family protein [Oligoflexia bacterium]